MDFFRKAHNHNLLAIVGLFGLLPFIPACEAKRQNEFRQGDGAHLYSIEDLSSKSSTLNTGERIKSGIASVTTSSKLVTSDKAKSLIEPKDIVSFDLNDDPFYINSEDYQYDFFGKENTSYQIKYTFTENHLIVNKLATIDELPSNERTYAKQVSGDLHQVPMFGFPISKYVIEHVVDSRGKKTNQLRSVRVEYLSEATHVSFNLGEIKFFETASKLDNIPSDTFNSEDEWFFTKTLVDRPAIPSGKICSSGGICNEIGLQEASGKISFKKTQSSIVAYDVNIPDATPVDRTRQGVIEIPVKWLDYKIDQQGLTEQEIDDDFPGARTWHERQYAQIDFKRVGNISASNSNGFKIELLEVSKDYLGFKVFESQTQRSYLYSFAKAPKKSKSPRIYPISDHKKFGYFKTIKSVIEGDTNISRTEEIDSLVYLNRIYPKEGEDSVTIYLTKDSARHPDGDYAKAVSDAIESWNIAFSKANAGFSLKFGGTANEDRVENGDVRYHKVAIYHDDRRSRLLGYGPSVSDSKTGETFSSSNHIYLRNYKQGLKNSIQKFIYWQLGAYEDITIGAIDEIIAAELDGSAAETSMTDSFYSQSSENSVQLAFNGQLNNFSLDAQKSDEPTHEANSLNNEHLEKYSCNYLENSMPITVKKIQQKCLSNDAENSKFARYLDLMKSQRSDGDQAYARSFDDRDGTLNEAAALEDCASRLIGDKLRATLVHEFGHNFGLRHNFAASADRDNLLVDPENQSRQTSASVMDYAHNDADRNINLGSYDFAAVRYAYANEIELVNANRPEDTKFVKIQNGQSVDATVAQHPGYILKQYKFCTDDDVSNEYAQIPTFDPQCKRWDNGSTAVEIAKDVIQQMSSYILTNTKRLDRESGFPSTASYNSRIEQKYLFSLKQIYDHYRWLLAGKNALAPVQQLSLQGLGDDEIDRLKTNAKDRFGQEFVEYDKAASLIKDFLIDLVFNLDNMYCVISDKNDAASIPYALVFGIERMRIIREQDYTIKECQDPELQPRLISGYHKHQEIMRSGHTRNHNPDYAISSFGVPIELSEARNEYNPLELKVVQHGLLGLRQAAAKILFANTGFSTKELQTISYSPSIADEPAIREAALDLLMERFLYGKFIGQENQSGETYAEENPDLFFPDFISEMTIYDVIVNGIKGSLNFSQRKSLDFEFNTNSIIEAEEFKRTHNMNNFQVLKAAGSYSFANKKDNPRAFKIIKKLNSLLAAAEAFGFELHRIDTDALSEKQINGIRAILNDRLMLNKNVEDVDALLEDSVALKEKAEQIKDLARYWQRYGEDLTIQVEQLIRLI